MLHDSRTRYDSTDIVWVRQKPKETPLTTESNLFMRVWYAYGLMGGAWTTTLKREYTLESDAIISWIIRCLIASKWQYFSFRCFGFRWVSRSVRKLFFPYTFAYFILCIISPSGHYMNDVSWCRCCPKDIRIGRSCNGKMVKFFHATQLQQRTAFM